MNMPADGAGRDPPMEGLAMKRMLLSGAASVATVIVLQPMFVTTTPAQPYDDSRPVTAQPRPDPDVRPYFFAPEHFDRDNTSQMIAHLREKVKYVFVIFNENHSFDNEFGTFPGVNGIYSDG